MPRGGARPGSGRKKGSKVIDKEMARELLRQKVVEKFGPLIDAQIANAMGIKYLMARDKAGGRFRRLERVPEPGELVEGPHEIIEVWSKDPSIQAFTDLMNRALDKPKEQPHDVNLKVSGDIVARLEKGRARAAKSKRGK